MNMPLAQARIKQPFFRNTSPEVIQMAKAKKKRKRDDLPTDPAGESQRDYQFRKISVGYNKRGGQSSK